jgi:cytochrome c peroxidase
MQNTNADNTPQTNPITNAGATLGRVLFYDKRLSLNNSVSCGSCHSQANGFADPAQFSTGFQGGLTGRHGPALGNAKFYRRGKFFWDERAATLEDQALMPIQNEVEMGMTLPDLVTKLQNTSFYPQLFQDAFGTPEVTSDRISKALAQFMRAMVTYQAKFDQSIVTPLQSPLTASEQNGRNIFNNAGHCGGCHGTNAFIAVIPENNGLDATITDVGVGNGAFKVPSLRNVAVRGRFMHDGRFTSLDQVVEFYNSGVQNNPGLSPALKTPQGQPIRLNLTAQEKADLIAFLQALTDNTFLNDPKFSNPFPN